MNLHPQLQVKTIPTVAQRPGQLLQRKCACGQHTVAGGECEACRKKREATLQRAAISAPPVGEAPPIVHEVLRAPGQPLDAETRAFMEPRFGHDFSRIPTHPRAGGAIQTKLAINTPGDAYEQEADRVADQVVAAPVHPAVSGALPPIQRDTGQATEGTETAPARVDQALASLGRPLEPALRQDRGQRFDHDFSGVRVQSGAVAEQSARDVNAHAYTAGHNMVFGASRFAPGTHVVQRAARAFSGVAPSVQASEPQPEKGDAPPAATTPGGAFDYAALFDPKSPGERVPNGVRTRFEQQTGASLASVRVHTGTSSQRTATALQARAFTVGQNIHFAAGEFQPGTPQGDHLLAHELTHTVQQQVVTPTPQRQSELSEPEDAAEEEADAVADAIIVENDEGGKDGEDEDEYEVPAITARPSPIAMERKKKAKTKQATPAKATQPKQATPAKAAQPKPVPFSLFSTSFKAFVDSAGGVTVKAAKKADGWTFTPAGANTVTAERAFDHIEYVHASGTAEPFVERATITVPAGGPATVLPIVAVLGDPATLTIPLSGPKQAAKRKSVVVNGATIEQLDLPASAITFIPADGDAIHLALGGDAWVFTTLKQDAVAPATATTNVKGFFRVGDFTRYKGTYGTATPAISEASRQTAIEGLAGSSTPKARRITTEESDAFKTVSVIESDFAGVQTYDSGILSFGIAQWTVNADLPQMLMKVNPAVFQRYLGRYGLAVDVPVRQLDASVAKFSRSNRQQLGIRNKSEGALFLGGRELVTQALLTNATTRAAALDALAKQATALKAGITAAKPDLTSKDSAKKSVAMKAVATAKAKLGALRTALKGLPGLKNDADPEKHADILFTVATAAHDAAKEVVDNCSSSQVMRGSEWALRFEMLGQDPGGQDAELAQARETFNKVKALSTHGASYATLLPNDRGRAALLSSYFNTPVGTQKGMGRAVDKFKVKKKAEAKAASAAATAAKKPAPSPAEADWNAFPWKTSDARWTTFWPTAINDFETIAIVEITADTTDPKRRRDIIGKLFP